jgi:hypothetical protein
MEVKLLTELDVEVRRGEVLRYLGQKQGRPVPQKIAIALEKELLRASELLHPRAAYVILMEKDLPEQEVYADARGAAFALSTIGPDLEREAARFMDSGELTRGVILDAIGSEAAESLADRVNREICSEAHGMGFQAERRISPGYGSYGLEEQRTFFRLLPAEALGIRLTEGFMMEPRKSVSFLVRLVTRSGSAEDRDPCSHCGLKNCPYRKEKAHGSTAAEDRSAP